MFDRKNLPYWFDFSTNEETTSADIATVDNRIPEPVMRKNKGDDDDDKESERFARMDHMVRP